MLSQIKNITKLTMRTIGILVKSTIGVIVICSVIISIGTINAIYFDVATITGECIDLASLPVKLKHEAVSIIKISKDTIKAKKISNGEILSCLIGNVDVNRPGFNKISRTLKDNNIKKLEVRSSELLKYKLYLASGKCDGSILTKIPVQLNGLKVRQNKLILNLDIGKNYIECEEDMLSLTPVSSDDFLSESINNKIYSNLGEVIFSAKNCISEKKNTSNIFRAKGRILKEENGYMYISVSKIKDMVQCPIADVYELVAVNTLK
jgi:hypothetical protein